MNIISLPLDQWHGHDPEFKYDERTLPIRYIVLHTTDGTDSRNWLSAWNRTNPHSEQNQVSIHYLVQRNGNIYKIIDEEKRAWHVGKSQMQDGETDGNSAAIGVEIEHLNEADFPEAQLNAVAILVHDIMQRHNIDGKHVVSHASVARPVGRKIDPVHFDWANFWDRVTRLTSPAPISAPVAVLPYSHLSLTLATPQIDAGKLTEYLVHKHKYKNYDEVSVRKILGYYITYGTQIGIDYVFALAQMIHETGWLDSWWAARPRRNPAGIGVTGQTTTKNPNDPIHWAQVGKVWKKGQSFESWDYSVQQHLARILIYARKDEDMTPEQLEFSNQCRDKQNLAHIQGVAHQWVGFNGVWAVPGRTYAQQLATIANSFIKNAS